MKYLIALILSVSLCGAMPSDPEAVAYMGALNDMAPFLDTLETNFYDFGDYTLSAVIENTTKDNVATAICVAATVYNEAQTDHKLKVYVKDPSGELIGSGMCYKQWADAYNANASEDALGVEMEKVRKTITVWL